jgi:hypothetical protein
MNRRIINSAKKVSNMSVEAQEKAFLEENPDVLPECGIVTECKHIPEMRRIIFLNGRDPGVPLDFHYASKTHPLKFYTLYHGQEHDLPVEVIYHLEDCGENQYGYRTGRSGHPEMYVKSKKYIFQCKATRDSHRAA